MLVERLRLIPEEELKTLRDRLTVHSELDLRDPNMAMTELIRAMVYREFKTIDASPNRWAMQGNLVQTDTTNTYKMQIFLNITGASNVYLQVEIIHAGDQPQLLVKGNFTAAQALDLINKLPYFPRYEATAA